MQPGQIDLLNQSLCYQFKTILDVGTGDGSAAKFFSEHKKNVSATGYGSVENSLSKREIKLYESVNLEKLPFADGEFDAVWCAHVLEHCMNIGVALSEIRRILGSEGILFLSVPEYSPHIVCGHVSTGWNLGQLMYVLILAGFDAKNGHFINYQGHLTAFIRKGKMHEELLSFDIGDIAVLNRHFPKNLKAPRGFNGDLERVNWVWTLSNRNSIEMKQFFWRCRQFIGRLLPSWLLGYLKRRRIYLTEKRMKFRQENNNV